MVSTHGFDRRALSALLSEAKINQDVIKAISAPATSRPWYQFKRLCVDEEQIENGVAFWNRNAETLERARREFGVPEEILVAIVGIETRYGLLEDHFNVVDSLYTLAFAQTKRSSYFRSELEQFLLLGREQGWDVKTVNGSFAGALGWPQFMPSNYRRYAIDYNADGGIDLWGDVTDVIGSIGNYLRTFGWKDAQPLVVPVRVTASDPQPLLDLGLKPKLTVAQWKKRGVQTIHAANDSSTASLFAIELVDGFDYWLGFENFYALLQYNYSRNYVMAVYELGEEIKVRRQRLNVSRQ